MDIPLSKKDAAIRIEPRSEQDRGRVQHAPPQLRGVVGHGDRVQVDNAVDRRIAAVLALDVLTNGTDVVAEVLAPRGLDSAEDPHGAKQRTRAMATTRTGSRSTSRRRPRSRAPDPRAARRQSPGGRSRARA